MKIVAIGDLHVHPDYDLKRLEALGLFCADERPDVIVQIGDWSELISFNRHGTAIEHEGDRWVDDIEVTKDSLATFMRPMYNRKKTLPRRVITLGNHENWINKWVGENPKAAGHVGVDMLGHKEFGFEVYDYMREVDIAGFDFVHNLGSQTGRPAPITSPSNGIKSLGKSTVVGHSHRADLLPVYYRNRTVWGVDLGCAIHRDMGHGESWSHPTAHKYRRCVWVFDNAENGDADFRVVRLESLGV